MSLIALISLMPLVSVSQIVDCFNEQAFDVGDITDAGTLGTYVSGMTTTIPRNVVCDREQIWSFELQYIIYSGSGDVADDFLMYYYYMQLDYRNRCVPGNEGIYVDPFDLSASTFYEASADSEDQSLPCGFHFYLEYIGDNLEGTFILLHNSGVLLQATWLLTVAFSLGGSFY